jgi:hypothetical protein
MGGPPRSPACEVGHPMLQFARDGTITMVDLRYARALCLELPGLLAEAAHFRIREPYGLRSEMTPTKVAVQSNGFAVSRRFLHTFLSRTYLLPSNISTLTPFVVE